LYAKIDQSTAKYKEDGSGDISPMKERDGHFYLDALIRISSIYLSGKPYTYGFRSGKASGGKLFERKGDGTSEEASIGPLEF
jgi:hypothetical protein